MPMDKHVLECHFEVSSEAGIGIMKSSLAVLVRNLLTGPHMISHTHTHTHTEAYMHT